jgi:hypothetical protein
MQFAHLGVDAGRPPDGPISAQAEIRKRFDPVGKLAIRSDHGTTLADRERLRCMEGKNLSIALEAQAATVGIG